MRQWFLIGLTSVMLSGAWASPGAEFWECFGELNTGGYHCMWACTLCKQQTGSAVICASVCRLSTIPAGTHAGVRITP